MVKYWSTMLLSLLGLSCICSKPSSCAISRNWWCCICWFDPAFMDFFIQLMCGRSKPPPRTMCLHCLFFVPCIEQARSLWEHSMAEGGLWEAPMVMGFNCICNSDYDFTVTIMAIDFNSGLTLMDRDKQSTSIFVFILSKDIGLVATMENVRTSIFCW